MIPCMDTSRDLLNCKDLPNADGATGYLVESTSRTASNFERLKRYNCMMGATPSGVTMNNALLVAADS